jgi:hypothetical protein
MRYFGHMQVDEEKLTDNSGTARFAVPEGLPGDTAGNISFSAQFTDEQVFGSVSKDTSERREASKYALKLRAKRPVVHVRKARVGLFFHTDWGACCLGFHIRSCSG